MGLRGVVEDECTSGQDPQGGEGGEGRGGDGVGGFGGDLTFEGVCEGDGVVADCKCAIELGSVVGF